MLFSHIAPKETQYFPRVISEAEPGFSLGGDTLVGQPRGGSRGCCPPDAGELSKMFKDFLTKLLKCIILAYFSIKVNKPCVNFSRVWTKNTNFGKFWEILEIFQKYFLRNLQNIHCFSIFFKKINKPMRSFLAVGTKYTNWLEILRNLCKSLIKIQ